MSARPTDGRGRVLPWVAAVGVGAFVFTAANVMSSGALTAMPNPMLRAVKLGSGLEWDAVVDVSDVLGVGSPEDRVAERIARWGFDEGDIRYFEMETCRQLDAVAADVRDRFAARCSELKYDVKWSYANRDAWMDAPQGRLADHQYVRTRTEFPCRVTYSVLVFNDNAGRLAAALGSHSETGCL